MKDKLEKLEELLNSTKKRVKETKEKEEEVRKVKEKFIESRSVKSIYLVGVTDVNKSDYYSVRNLFGEIFRGINRELIEIAKKEFKETPIPENLTVEELSKLAKLIENPVPKSIKEIKLYSWEKDNSDLFIKYASEWLNNFIGEYFPDIRIASEGLSSVINAVDLGRINVILERFERIEINRNGRGLNSIIDNFVLEDCEKNVRLEYRLANNYRDDIHSLFRTHFSNFKLSGDYIVKLNNFSIIGVEGR